MRKSTKELLAESLEDLVSKKSFEKITVKEIAENCGVTTTTFYNHFMDKYELMTYNHRRNLEMSVMNSKKNKGTFYDLVLDNICFVGDHSEYITNVSANTHGRDYYGFRAWNYGIELAERYLAKNFPDLEITEDIHFLIEFYLSAATHQTQKWASTGMKMSREKLAELIVDAMPLKLRPYFIGSSDKK